MKFIPLKSAKLLKHLTTITDQLYEERLVKIIAKTKKRGDNLITNFHPCSDDYLFKAFEHKITDFGFPRACLGMGMQNNQGDPYLGEVTVHIEKAVNNIMRYLGSPTNALTMAYPDKGFIGWHHNGNAPGFNILMTYSQDGDGYFKYYDYDSKSIVTMPDTKGWSVKVGYYPHEVKEKEKVYWHCASTAKQRISVAFILNHRDMWENMIDTISEGTYDKSVLSQQQMTH